MENTNNNSMSDLFDKSKMSNEDIGKPVLEFRDIVKKYDGKNALDHLTLTVNKGDIYGFVGENGAGKSTAMRVLAGLIEVNSGEFLINGVSSTDPRIIEERKKMGAIIEQPALFHGFTAYDNLKMNLILSGQKPDPERIKSILERVGLKDLYNSKKKAGNFSLGMRQRLGIAMAFVNNVDILILDEPINGLDPTGIVEIRNLILDLHKMGATIFISSHILTELSLIATRYGFISHGKIVKELSTEELHNITEKKTILKTTNNNLAQEILKGDSIKVELVGDTLEIAGEFELSKAVSLLSKEGIDVADFKTINGSIEDYYMHIINGGNDNGQLN